MCSDAVLVGQGLTSHQTHYRSYWGRGEMLDQTDGIHSSSVVICGTGPGQFGAETHGRV